MMTSEKHANPVRMVFRCSIFWLISFSVVSCRHPAVDARRDMALSGPHYAFLFGQKYRTKVDLYRFAFTRETEPLYYLGTRAGGLAFGPRELPERTNWENVGRVVEARPEDGPNDIFIAGIVPAGS